MASKNVSPDNEAAVKALLDSFNKAKPLVDVNDLSHSFGQGESEKQVLFDNSLRIFPGEVVIMSGPSGSGKTTLLTLIGALRSIQKGSLTVMGRQLNNLNRKQQMEVRSGIGFIFQHHNLFDALTALQNVRLATEVGPESKASAHRAAQEMLVELGLGERLHYKPQKLSGGQRQRVAIARALVNRPGLILADEPTAALDKGTGREVVKIFRRRADQDDCSVLIVSHDNRILDVADRIINMVDGHIASNVEVKSSIALAHLIKQCRFFDDLGQDSIGWIGREMVMEKHEAGVDIIREGELGDKFYVLVQGSVEVHSGAGGLLTTLGPGDYFGEIALMEDSPRLATVTATDDCLAMSLRKELFLNIIAQSSSFEEQLRLSFFSR